MYNDYVERHDVTTGSKTTDNIFLRIQIKRG